MMKEMYCVKVSFRGYTGECESRLTNIFVKMGLTVNKTGVQEYTIISKDENTIVFYTNYKKFFIENVRILY